MIKFTMPFSEAKMARPRSILDGENLRGVFHKVMQANQLTSKDVKKDRQHKIEVADKGLFDCNTCSNKWESRFSWITFDLIDMKIIYRWKMKCRVCYTVCEPTFTIEQLEAMFDKAVRCYKGERIEHVTFIGQRYGPRPQPHRPDLCEKCRWGIEHCWYQTWHCV